MAFSELRFELRWYDRAYPIKVCSAHHLVFEGGRELEAHHLVVGADDLEAWWDFIHEHVPNHEYERSDRDEELAEIREDFA